MMSWVVLTLGRMSIEHLRNVLTVVMILLSSCRFRLDPLMSLRPTSIGVADAQSSGMIKSDDVYHIRRTLGPADSTDFI